MAKGRRWIPFNPNKPHRKKTVKTEVWAPHTRKITRWQKDGWNPRDIRRGLTFLDVDFPRSQLERRILPSLRLNQDANSKDTHDTLKFSVTNLEDDNVNGFSHITGMPSAPPSTDATSLAAKYQLYDHQIVATRGHFKLGWMFARFTRVSPPLALAGSAQAPERSTRHIQIMIAVRNDMECCYCILVQTNNGNGIKHLQAEMEAQTRNNDRKAAAVQIEMIKKDIDAHAIVYSNELPPRRDPEEPEMKKEPLRVKLDGGISHQVVDRMSRACFTRIISVSHGEIVASIGHLDPFSQVCLENSVVECLGIAW